MLNTLSRISILLVAGTLAAMAADPLMGTWKVIPESVKPGGNGPKKIVMKFEPGDIAGDVKFTLTGEMNDQPYSYTWTAKPGGGKFPIEGRSGMQVEFQRPAENHTVTIHYRDGQESRVMSRPSRVMAECLPRRAGPRPAQAIQWSPSPNT